MCFVYTVQNMNPRLGARKGDRQAISVYDRNIGNRRDIITTPDAAEEFISDRNKHWKVQTIFVMGFLPVELQ